MKHNGNSLLTWEEIHLLYAQLYSDVFLNVICVGVFTASIILNFRKKDSHGGILVLLSSHGSDIELKLWNLCAMYPFERGMDMI